MGWIQRSDKREIGTGKDSIGQVKTGWVQRLHNRRHATYLDEQYYLRVIFDSKDHQQLRTIPCGCGDLQSSLVGEQAALYIHS